MRSSKQRSRSNKNRNNNRNVGNVVNRVFDSSGPEGKVRGTPQQIIDKYNQLARDSQLAGDRVATENFQQHAEHYTRMLAEAMKEQEARREAQEAQHRERQQQQAEQRAERQERAGGGDQPRDQRQPQEQRAPKADQQEQPQPQLEDAPQPELDMPAPAAADVIDVDSGDTGLVETPENKPAPKPRQRRTRKPAAPKDAPEAAE